MAAIAVLALTLAAAFAGEALKMAGNWQFSMETPHGKMAGVFKVQQQDGAKLSGVCEIENQGSNPMTGVIDGKKVEMSVSVHDGQMTFKFSGTVDGNKMSGSTDPQGATWTATRQ